MLTINNLFNNENFKIKSIVIPEIQRDYVQGLEEYSYKLNNFLDVLFNALSSKNSKDMCSKDSKDMCSLDFIYGNIDTNGVFEPIDGQQRITTLALLYYYIEVIINKNYDNNIFKHISYKTKKTATDFCTLLNDKDFIDYLSNNKNMDINNAIKDYYKYYDIYNYDLTIESMINTLHLIQKKYKDVSNISFENITFNIFPMESFNLSDDLYIKMNGRGKQLSSFDNFKADYFKWLEDASNDNIDKLIPDSFGENSIDKLNTLKRKFNTDYIDIFWDYALKNSEDTDNIPDPEKLFFRFINRFVVGKILSIINNDKNEEYKQYINQFLSCNEKFKDFTSEEQDNVIDIFIKNVDTYFFSNNGSKTEDNSIEYFNFDFYRFILSKYNSRLINILDNLSKKDDNNNCFLNKISDYFKAGWEKEFNIFNDFKNYKELFVYNTILSFLENRLSEEYIEKEIQCLSRLVWNVAEQYDLVTGIYKNTYISIANRFNFLSEIYMDDTNNSNNNYDIYNCFIKANKDYNQAGYLKTIIEDEVRKCQYLYDDNKVDMSLEQMFINLERLPYLKGTIGFLLGNDKNNFETIYELALSEFNRYEETNDKNKKDFIDKTNNYFFNRYILYKYFLKNKLDIEKYNEKLFTLQALKPELIIDNDIRQFAIDSLKDSNAFIDSANFFNNYMNNMEYIKDKSFIYITSFLYSLYMLLYAKDDSHYLINNYYILDKFLPCIIHKDQHRGRFAKNKRLNSIFGDTYIIDTINAIIDACRNLSINLKTIPNEINIFIDNSGKKTIYNNIVAPVGDAEIQLHFEVKGKQYAFILNKGIGIKNDNEVTSGIWIPIQSIEHLEKLTKIIINIINKLTDNETDTLLNIINDIKDKDLSDTLKDAYYLN